MGTIRNKHVSEQLIVRYEEENPAELTKKQFQNLKAEIKNPKEGIMSDELVDFYLWQDNLPLRVERFANYICRFMPKSCSVLEVGCGRTARLSRILQQKGYKVCCMDPVIDEREVSGIPFFKEKFDWRKTDISMYDYVIGEEPCDATEHIVRACVRDKKPMIISLCGVPHKLIKGTMPKDVEEWYSYLMGISQDHLKLRHPELIPFVSTSILKTVF